MYIIFLNKNKQYTINKKKIVKMDLIKNLNAGDKIKIENVLYIKTETENKIGTPKVENKEMILEIVKHIKEKKKIVLKFKRRKGYIKKNGHRQQYTILKFLSIKDKKV